MRILSRYVFREFLTPLFYCLAGFLSIYVLFELFGSFARIVDSDLSIGDIVLYFCGYLAPFFHYLAPAALMLATLYTMWMFCRHSEIIAMRASGVSFFAIVKPILLIAFMMALFVTWVAECFVPTYSPWAAQLKSDRFDLSKIVKADNIVYRNAVGNRTWNIDALLKKDGTSLKNVKVTVDRPGGERERTIIAERADYLDGEWFFSGVKVQHYDLLGQEVATLTPELDALSLRSYPDFSEEPADFIAQNRPWKYNSTLDRLRYLETHPELDKKNRDECLYDTLEKIMAPFACLIITLFAIPAGIASGRQSVFRGIVGALALFFSYYGVTILAMVLAKTGYCPPFIAAIFPAALFLTLGIIAFRKQR